MLHKVIGMIKRSHRSTAVQAYYNSTQRGRETSGPTFDEARKDFKNYESMRFNR